MGLPENKYLTVYLDAPTVVQCEECQAVTSMLAIANEFVVEDGKMGIKGVVRYATCGHASQSMEADPKSVAWMQDAFETEQAFRDQLKNCDCPHCQGECECSTEEHDDEVESLGETDE